MAARNERSREEPASEAGLAGLGRALLEAPSDPAILGELERVSERTGDWASLAEIYRRVASQPLRLEQQVDLRCRLARLYSVHLGAPERAIATYRRVLDLCPARADVAEALERLYVTTERWEALVDYLGESGAQDQLIDILARHLSDAAVDQAASYLQIARLCEERLGDPGRAIEAAERALSSDPGSLDALRALSRLYREVGAYERCLDALDLELGTVSGDGDRIAVLEEMERLCEEELGDVDRAAECIENILLIDGERADAYRRLAGCYQRMSAWPKLADCHERHAAVEPDPAARADLWASVARIHREELGDPERAVWALQQLASVRETELGDDDRAASAYWSMLELDPDARAADAALERIYGRGQRWRELADVLARRASLAAARAADDAAGRPADDPAAREVRVATLVRLAGLLEVELGDVAAALAVYQELLELEPGLEPARAALERLLRDPEHALAAARVLEPIYGDSDERGALIGVCEVLCAHEEDPWQRSELLARIARLEQSLGRPAAALRAFERALAEDSSDESILDDMERLAAATGDWAALAQSYARVAAASPDAELQGDLRCRLGRIYKDELGDLSLAIASYRAALEVAGGDAAAGELEELYARAERWGELADHLRDRGSWNNLVDVLARYLPDERDAQVSRYLDVAQVCERRLGDLDQAIEAAERALAIDPASVAAMRALLGLHRRIGAHERCLDMLELELGTVRGDGERIAVLGEMARLYEEELDDLDRAAECVESILTIDGARVDAYRQLASYYRRMTAWPALAACYRRHIAVELEPASRVALQRALAELYAEELHDDAGAAAVYTELQAELPGDASVRDALARLHRKRGAPRG